MTKTVVHVTTLDEWKAVLDVWFNQGYKWNTGDTQYSGHLLRGNRYLVLQFFEGSYYIHCANEGLKSIEYSEFMAQQKEDKEVKTYYVTQETLNTIEVLKNKDFPLNGLLNEPGRPLSYGLNAEEEKALLRYLGGDETIEFKVKEPLYRLWRLDKYDDTVYFTKKWGIGSPVTASKNYAFTAPLEEIKKWQTPAWEIEKAD